MGDLPVFRFEQSPAFSAVCMDLFGPLLIRDDCVKKGPRIYKKVWGVIFTCTASRAIHLDVAIDYSTEAVLHTIRRLMALRGDINIIISDPGTQLIAADEELAKSALELIRDSAPKIFKLSCLQPNTTDPSQR